MYFPYYLFLFYSLRHQDILFPDVAITNCDQLIPISFLLISLSELWECFFKIPSPLIVKYSKHFYLADVENWKRCIRVTLLYSTQPFWCQVSFVLLSLAVLQPEKTHISCCFLGGKKLCLTCPFFSSDFIFENLCNTDNGTKKKQMLQFCFPNKQFTWLSGMKTIWNTWKPINPDIDTDF